MRAKEVQNFTQGADPYKTLDIGLHTDENRMNYIEKRIQQVFDNSTLKFEKIAGWDAIVPGSYELYFNDNKEHTLFYNPVGSTTGEDEFEDGWVLENPHDGQVFRYAPDDFANLTKGLITKLKHVLY